MHRKGIRWLEVLLLSLSLVGFAACNGDDDDDNGKTPRDTGTDVVDGGDTGDTSGDTTGDTTDDTMVADTEDDGGDADAGPEATEFTVTLSNISDQTGRPTPFSPGTWAVHDSSNVFFEDGEPDRGDGLEPLAEDGDGSELATTLMGSTGVSSAGTFGSAPIPPGDSVSFSVEASPGDGGLSLATMFVQSNDIIAAPSSGNIPLFDNDGMPLGQRDVTDQFGFYDAGTERNQAPGLGPVQAPRQNDGNTGAREGVVAHFEDGTRTIPDPAALVDISVSESNGEFTVTIDNVSTMRGAMTTPIAPAFWAIHDSSFSFFTAGQPAGDALETLAEDGSPADLVNEHTGADGTLDVGASGSPAPPGQGLTFSVTPNADHPTLSFAAMVVESNDVFLALDPSGVDLLDSSGNPRDASDIADEITRRLAIWDAGTEANEVPGVGPNQPARQSATNTGPDDPNDTVRIYNDATNDLGGPQEGKYVEIDITHGSGANDFKVVIENKSDQTVYPGGLTPVAWAIHESGVDFFTSGQPASSALEGLAEDGDAQGFVDSLPSQGVLQKGVAAIPDDESSAGPISPGDSYSFSVTPDADHPYLSIATMVIPSNDTFLAFNPSSVRLLNASGNRRGESAIETDVRSSLRAWNAGTEANQAGAAGPDQAPQQSAPNTGPSEGNGTVRALNDPVWVYPELADTLQITVEPTQ